MRLVNQSGGCSPMAINALQRFLMGGDLIEWQQ